MNYSTFLIVNALPGDIKTFHCYASTHPSLEFIHSIKLKLFYNFYNSASSLPVLSSSIYQKIIPNIVFRLSL